MRNERNVAALAELLHDIIPNSTAFGVKPKGPVEECDFCKEAARALAASGVLAPSALTDEEISDVRTCGHTLGVPGSSEWYIHEPGTPSAVRFVLDRIAKGEEPVDA